MSHLYQQSKEEADFEMWLDEEGFCRIHGDYYMCPGDHIWHESDVNKLYSEALKGGWASHD